MVTVDRTLLEAALYGYERQRDEIEAKIAEIRSHMSGTKPAAVAAAPGQPKKRVMNAAARRRIAAAQRKRWAEYKRTHGTPVKEVKAKRVLSAAARKHIADATRKRWIEYRAAKAAAQKAAAKPARKAAAPKRAAKKSAAPVAETATT